MAADNYDVAIAGFGPSGAIAAALLGQAGVNVYVCDRAHDVYDKPRAIALDHEILRVFQHLGIADEVAQYCEPFTDSCYYGLDGQMIRRMTVVPEPYPQAHQPSVVFTQPPVEAVLRRKIATLASVTVETGMKLETLQQSADDVTLTLKAETGEHKTVKARYLIGCDGASSTVREQVGLTLQDLDFDEPWLVVDVLANEQGLAKLPTTSVQYCEPERPCSFVMGPGNHRRWEISLKPGEDPVQAATPDGAWRLLERWIGPQDAQLWRQASYRFHALVAENWRVGRVFIAGDAAHQQPPFLGQGMCQGVRDVSNLIWKLQAVLDGRVQGHAAEALLDSYSTERKEHVRQLTTTIKSVGAVICERDVDKARARDARLLAEQGGSVRPTPRQDILPRLTTGLLVDSPAAGSLFPQPWLLRDGSRQRMDDVLGGGWRLVVSDHALALDPQLQAATGMQRVVLHSQALTEADGLLAAWFARHNVTAALVRPDHYVYATAVGSQALADLQRDLLHRLTA